MRHSLYMMLILLMIFAFVYPHKLFAEDVKYNSGIILKKPEKDDRSWKFSLHPELWLLNTKIHGRFGYHDHYNKGWLAGLTLCLTDTIKNENSSIYLTYRYGKTSSDKQYISASGQYGTSTDNNSHYELELKTRFISTKKCWFFYPYIATAFTYTEIDGESRWTSPSWRYNATGTNLFIDEYTYITLGFGVGMLCDFTNKFKLFIEFLPNYSYVEDKIKNALSGVKNSYHTMGYGYEGLGTLVYEINHTFNIQAGMRLKRLNEENRDSWGEQRFLGYFFKLGINF